MRKILLPLIVLSLVGGVQAQTVPPDSTQPALNERRQDQWLGKDKFDHALASTGLVAAQFYFLHRELEWSRSQSRRLAVSSTLMLGFAKEVYDQASRRGTASWKDILADGVGIGLAIVFVTQR